jgi:hypothetical protein
MKKILLLSVFAAVAFVGCKKKENTVSTLVTVSYPTVTITSQQFFSFPVGGGPLPTANTISATAYDSFYHQKVTPVVDASSLSSLVPGLFFATVSAKNSYGFIGYAYIYVAITNITDSINLGGQYVRIDDNDTVNVAKLARGLYRTDNVGGVPRTTSTASLIIPGYFVQQNYGTLDMPAQKSSLGTFYGTSGTIGMVIADTTFQYVIGGIPNFGSNLITFKKL